MKKKYILKKKSKSKYIPCKDVDVGVAKEYRCSMQANLQGEKSAGGWGGGGGTGNTPPRRDRKPLRSPVPPAEAPPVNL